MLYFLISVTCRLDNDCFLGHICLNNICMIGCRENVDCSATEACINNRCTNPCSSKAVCGPNAECNAINHRAQCTCPIGFIPNPSPNVACVREPITCKINSDCDTGFICNSGTCIAICSSSNNCLANEQCDGSICKPVCRRDDDCRSGEICGNLMCVAGCRSDNECPTRQACINNQCIDPCQKPNACGNNAKCSITNHRIQCSCSEGLVGDPYVNCRLPPTSCKNDNDCPNKMSCFSGTCKSSCSIDQDCLNNEKCTNGVCKEICNSDTQCGDGSICENRLCIIGCRLDSSCPLDSSCINKQCRNPCDSAAACGTCADCQVVEHQVQCSCKANTVGNPFVGCTATISKCTSNRDCRSREKCSSGYCFRSCQSNSQCNCGETCENDVCHSICSDDSNCAHGFLCRNSVCVAGCKSNSDCPSTHGCINGQCKDSCEPSPCGKNTECRAADHRPICLCKVGYAGDPSVECKQHECLENSDCSTDLACINKECKNLCLDKKICGTNAQCQVLNHEASCSCPPEFYGNPLTECKKEVNECLDNPCAQNAVCTNTVGSFDCKCLQNCEGDPYNVGCMCPQDQLNQCAFTVCGTNAKCRLKTNSRKPTAECYCPPEYPSGNPLVSCKLFNKFVYININFYVFIMCGLLPIIYFV